MKIAPVILCGGSGTRLWPLSRAHHPKQFLKLCGSLSLFQATVLRAAKISNVGKTVVVANEAHRFLVAEHLQSIKVSADILLEPCARNTAPAIAAAAHHVFSEGAANPQLLLILPSDHLIADEEAFLQAIECARPLAQAGKLVTFGIPPTRPETGYGYIEVGKPLDNGHTINRFVEKPDLATASQYLQSGKHLWNSGIFLIRADVYLDTLRTHAPKIHRYACEASEKAVRDLDFIRLDAEAFSASPENSIDYAVMEKTSDGAVVSLDGGWNDIGSWDALASTQPKDESGNVIRGDIISIETRNSYLHSEGRLLAVIGINDLIVATTPDAVLVAHKSLAQRVKEIAGQLAAKGRSEADFHTIVHRPWGSYEGIDQGSRYQVKRIRVKPSASLSLQMHHHRAEHWVVVKGTAKVRCGDETRIVSENESTFIPLGMLHRLENPGKIELELIEVQSGSYLGEDDIVRFADDYGR